MLRDYIQLGVSTVPLATVCHKQGLCHEHTLACYVVAECMPFQLQTCFTNSFQENSHRLHQTARNSMSIIRVMVRHSWVALMQDAAQVVARGMVAVEFFGVRFVMHIMSSSILIRYRS